MTNMISFDNQMLKFCFKKRQELNKRYTGRSYRANKQLLFTSKHIFIYSLDALLLLEHPVSMPPPRPPLPPTT